MNRAAASTFNQRYPEFIEKFQILSYLWYLGWPFFFFILLAPGYLLSIPAAVSVDDGEKKIIAPKRVTWQAVLVHSVLFLFLVSFIVFLGAEMHIPFPHFVPLK